VARAGKTAAQVGSADELPDIRPLINQLDKQLVNEWLRAQLRRLSEFRNNSISVPTA